MTSVHRPSRDAVIEIAEAARAMFGQARKPVAA